MRRSPIALACLALGCGWLEKEGGNEALAILDVEVEEEVQAFDLIRFSVPSRADIPAREVVGSNRRLRFGYYLPDVTGAIAIKAEAIASTGCGGRRLVRGEGTRTTPSLTRGQAREAGPLTITFKASTCPGNPPASGDLTAGKVFDGDGPEELDHQNHGSSMVVRWADFGASMLTIQGYEYMISASADCTGPPLLAPSILGTGMLRYEAPNLRLPESKVYNCIRAFGGGQQSPWAASDGITLDFSPPTVVAVTPADKARGGPRNGPITVKFSEALHPSAVEGGLEVTLGAGDTPVPVKLALDAAGTTLSATPERALPMLALVNVKVTAKVQDLARNPAAASATSFTVADGTWSAPMMVDRHDNAPIQSPRPLIALDGNGRLVIVWERSSAETGRASHLHVYRHDPAAGWSKPVQLPRQGYGRATLTDVAFGDRGRLFVAYDQADDPAGARGSAWVHDLAFDTSAGFDNKLDESAGHQSLLPSVAYGLGVGETTRAIAAWVRLDSTAMNFTIMARGSLPGPGWAAPFEVDRGMRPSTLKLATKVVYDRLGNAHVIWFETDTAADPAAIGIVSVRRHERELGWQGIQRLSGVQRGIGPSPQIAVDAAGNAVALWTQNLGSEAAAAHGVFAAYFRIIDRTWGAPVRASATVPFLFSFPRLVMNGTGMAVATWVNGTGDLVVDRFDRGRWTEKPALRVGPHLNPAVGLDDQGHALVTWNNSLGNSDVVVARQHADGMLGEPVKLSIDKSTGGDSPQIAVLPDGRAVLVWVEGKPDKLMVSRFE